MTGRLPPLTHLTDRRLFAGDILRLSDNYDAGPGSGPVDLMVFDPRDVDAGLGVIVTSGYKAGLILHVFPRESVAPDGLGLCADWLVANWDRWIAYTYHPKDRIPVEKARVLRKEERSLPEEVR